MSVSKRLFFIIVLLSGSLMAQGQTGGINFGNLSFFNQLQLGSPVNSQYLPYKVTLAPKGAIVYTKGVTVSSVPMYVGESDQIRVNGPVDSGKPILLTGKKLLDSSVNIQILDQDGSTITFNDADVRFDKKLEQLRLDLTLEPGFYTLQIPVADGIVNKTVIIQ